MKVEKKRQAALALMKMNLSANRHGYMFFNEVLFGFYKNLYTHSKMFKDGLLNPNSVILIDDAEAQTIRIIDTYKNKT